jgi:hypothetical protein
VKPKPVTKLTISPNGTLRNPLEKVSGGVFYDSFKAIITHRTNRIKEEKGGAEPKGWDYTFQPGRDGL